MGGLRVALRTLSVECCLPRESDPRPHWHHVQGGAQEPQSGFLGRGGRAGRGWRGPDRRQGLQSLVPGQDRVVRFVEQIIEDVGKEEISKGFLPSV